MNHLVVHGWTLVVVGASCLAVAGIFTSMGWNLLRDNARKRVPGRLLIVVGALLLAGAGVLTTSGWNALQETSRMRALVAGVAVEWEINDTKILKDALFNPRDSVDLMSYGLYPRFKTSAIDAILSSGLFDAREASDMTLMMGIIDYQTSIEDINARLDVSDQFALSTLNRHAVAQHRRLVLDSVGFKSFIQVHRTVGILLRNYLSQNRKTVLADRSRHRGKARVVGQ